MCFTLLKSFLLSLMQTTIRETMVIPNFENVYIPFMKAEKDDWLPRQAAPYIWVSQEAGTDSTTIRETLSSPQKEGTESNGSNRETDSKPEYNENSYEKADGLQLHTKKSLLTSSESNQSSLSENTLEVLKPQLLGAGEAEPTPLLSKEELVERQESIPETQSSSRSASINDLSSRSASVMDEETHSTQVDESRTKRKGNTRAKMLDLRKKVGGKFEEGRRQIEEKGRNIVERIRAPEKSSS